MALVVTALAGVGCSGHESSTTLQVYTWWTADSELQAFDSVTNLFESNHHDVIVTNIAPTPGAKSQREKLNKMLFSGAAPATFQANIGADLLRWTLVDAADGGVASENRVAPLTELFAQSGLTATTLHSSLLPQLTLRAGGAPYAVPVNVHRLNVLYYNKQRVRVPPTLADLCPDNAEALLASSAAKPRFNISFPLKDDPWPMTLLTFENLLPAKLGWQFYDDLFHGHPPTGWTIDMRKVLACVAYMSRAFVSGTGNMLWVDAAASVASENGADLTIMGDWVNGQLKKQLTDQTVVEMPFPGTEQLFVFTSDTFPLPIDARHPNETSALLATLASPEAQRSFSNSKGSVPARRDVGAELLDVPNAAATIDALERVDVHKEVATSGLFPPYYEPSAMNLLLQALTDPAADSQTIDAALAWLEQQVPLFALWQDRLQGPLPPP